MLTCRRDAGTLEENIKIVNYLTLLIKIFEKEVMLDIYIYIFLIIRHVITVKSSFPFKS